MNKCPKRTNQSVQVCNYTNPTRIMQKTITVNGLSVDALFDSGSQVSLIRIDTFEKINPRPILNNENIELNGAGKGKFPTLGVFNSNIIMNTNLYKIEMYVVGSEETLSEIIIGQNFLNNHRVLIENGVVTVQPNEEISILNINIESDFPELPAAIQKLVKSYNPCKEVKTNVQTQIILKDETRVYQNPRRLALSEKEVVDKQIQQWLSDGIISRSSSEYASPILLTKKKDGSLRLCVDYRWLNQKIIKERVPFPNMEEQLDKLEKGKYFSTLDLENGFFHVPVEKSSRKYTAFCCHRGIFEYLIK